MHIMQNWMAYLYLSVGLVTLYSFESFGQGNTFGLSGVVYDSATRMPVPYVTVVNLTVNKGTTTADNGTFTLGCSPGDSILFTIMGYLKKKRVVGSNERSMIVFLRESSVTLNPITIYGSFKPQGSDQWKSAVEMPKTFRNPAGPGSGYTVETFGPGVSLGGLISRFSKSEKEKRKLVTVREKARQSETYLEVIVSEETKTFFKKTFSMSDEEYTTFVEQFNSAHPEAAYLESKDEIRNLMVMFKASRK